MICAIGVVSDKLNIQHMLLVEKVHQIEVLIYYATIVAIDFCAIGIFEVTHNHLLHTQFCVNGGWHFFSSIGLLELRLLVLLLSYLLVAS